MPLSEGGKDRGVASPPQIVVYCIYSHGQPARVDRNNWMYFVTRLSIKIPKQKAPTLAGEGLCFMRVCRRAWRCSCACPCGFGACCSGFCSWSTPPLRSRSLPAIGTLPARPLGSAWPYSPPLWPAVAAARLVPAPFRAVPYTRPPRVLGCPKRAAL